MTTATVLKLTERDGVTYKPGHYIHNIPVDGGLLALREKGVVDFTLPGDVCEPEGEMVRIVYIGKRLAEVPPQPGNNGIHVRYVPRCVPVNVAADHAEFLRGNPDYTVIETSGFYIGSASSIGDFDRDLKAKLPPAPSFLFMRDNGAGDVVMSTAAVREVKRRVPDCHITYATLPQHMQLLEQVDCIDAVKSVHDLDLEAENFDVIVNWARALENYDIERNQGLRIDSFARHIGLGELQDKHTEFYLNPLDIMAAQRILNGADGNLIAYVVQAAAWPRTWPLTKLPELLAEFERVLPEYTVVLIDSQPCDWISAPNAIDTGGQTETFKQAVAVAALCDLVITQDTGIAHAIGTLGLNTLALIGSIPPELRYSSYENFEYIHPAGRVDCCPCWDFQARYSDGERKGQLKSCFKTKKNECLDSITPREIVEKAKGMLSG